MHIYLFLATLHSGRVQVLGDLITNGLAPDDTAWVLTRPDDVISEDAALATCSGRWSNPAGAVQVEAIPEDTSHLFFVTHGNESPVDQIEAFKAWLDREGLELTRVLTLIDCTLAQKHPELLPWYQACVHFSDVVFLNYKQGTPNKTFNTWLKELQSERSPCLFETLKKGSVPNPEVALYPEARRLSHLFDNLDPIEALDLDEEALPEESFKLEVPADPYLARTETGQRCKILPDIAPYLADLS